MHFLILIDIVGIPESAKMRNDVPRTALRGARNKGDAYRISQGKTMESPFIKGGGSRCENL